MSRGTMWLALFGMLAFVVLIFHGCAALVSSLPSPTPTVQTGAAPAVAAAPIASAAAVAPASPSTETPEAATAPTVDEKNLGVTLDQYALNFNAIGAELNLGVDAKVGDVTPGPVNDVVQISLDEHRKVIIALQRDTRIVKDVTLIGAGDGTPASGITLMASALVATQAAVPASDRAAVGKAIGRLLGRMKPDAESVHETIGGRKVWMAMSPVTGFMAGVSPEGGK